MIKNGMRPVHPGEILREDCLKPLGIEVLKAITQEIKPLASMAQRLALAA